MKIELTPEDAQNLIVIIGDYPAKGQVQEVAVMLKQKLARALQEEQLAKTAPVEAAPSHDGAKEETVVD